MKYKFECLVEKIDELRVRYRGNDVLETLKGLKKGDRTRAYDDKDPTEAKIIKVLSVSRVWDQQAAKFMKTFKKVRSR